MHQKGTFVVQKLIEKAAHSEVREAALGFPQNNTSLGTYDAAALLTSSILSALSRPALQFQLTELVPPRCWI